MYRLALYSVFPSFLFFFFFPDIENILGIKHEVNAIHLIQREHHLIVQLVLTG